jgi:hypothetical protein
MAGNQTLQTQNASHEIMLTQSLMTISHVNLYSLAIYKDMTKTFTGNTYI